MIRYTKLMTRSMVLVLKLDIFMILKKWFVLFIDEQRRNTGESLRLSLQKYAPV